MLILPVAQWLVFWLYVNIDSVLIAFQFARGGWTLSNFSKLFMELGEGGSILSESVINTFVFFRRQSAYHHADYRAGWIKVVGE